MNEKKASSILILGSIPPPVGGVTTHVSRLLANLDRNHFDRYVFCDLRQDALLKTCANILKYKTIHVHISHPFLQVGLAALCRLTGKSLLITYHGNWDRYGILNNSAVNISARLCAVPIVQTAESLRKAQFWNKKAVLISTHLPAPPIPELSHHILKALIVFTKNYRTILCTNAWNVTFDKNGKETYGILPLIECIENLKQTALIVSDPSGRYSKYAWKTLGRQPENVIFVSESHDFRNILRLSDAFIRNTTTDGVSLSIHEAMELHVPVLASNAVERPAFCKTFETIELLDFERDIPLARNLLASYTADSSVLEPVTSLIQLYGEQLRV
jgi:glycosyltransferase involved in cell wall biosynthesis